MSQISPEVSRFSFEIIRCTGIETHVQHLKISNTYICISFKLILNLVQTEWIHGYFSETDEHLKKLPDVKSNIDKMHKYKHILWRGLSGRSIVSNLSDSHNSIGKGYFFDAGMIKIAIPRRHRVRERERVKR